MITTQNISILDSQLLDAGFNSPAIDVSKFTKYSIQAVFVVGTNTGTMKLQISDDATNPPTNFSDYPSSSKSISGASTVEGWEMTSVGHQWVRVSYTNSGGAGTTVSLRAFLKAEG